MGKVSDFIVKYLQAQGVEHVFELAGGMIVPLLDSARTAGLPLVSMHHEQAAGFAAEGMARVTGVPGVAFATSGPGATNLLTAIGSCYFDSTPAVFITGSVARNEMKGDRSVRQLGFQETDIVAMAKPVTKSAFRLMDGEDVKQALDVAFSTARSGRPGPVLIDIPIDVQTTEMGSDNEAVEVDVARQAVRPHEIALALSALGRATRPLVLVGGGCAGKDYVRMALECLNVPVVNSLMGTDVLGWDHPLRYGLIGSYGNRWANHAIAECDYLLVLGSRLDIRQTGTDVKGFADRVIFQVDADANEMNQRITGVNTICADVSEFCRLLVDASFPHSALRWTNHLDEMRAKWPDIAELKDIKGINPNVFMRLLGTRADRVAADFVIDVGQHQMWAAQSLRFSTGARFLTSGGMGAMGFALPAAIGAAFASPDPVVVIAGDGGFQLNLQELQTIVHHKLPVKMVVLNNHAHGMVRQFQDAYFGGRRQSTVDGYSAPYFPDIAMAYGIHNANWINRVEEVDDGLDRLFETKGPALLQVDIDVNTNVYPKLAFGRPITDMEPDVKPTWMEGT
jgi:acetolactate synthase I/II/III large subunit